MGTSPSAGDRTGYFFLQTSNQGNPHHTSSLVFTQGEQVGRVRGEDIFTRCAGCGSDVWLTVFEEGRDDWEVMGGPDPEGRGMR